MLPVDRAGSDPGQQLVQHDAERVDVGGRRDAPVAPLLGGGIFRRHQAQFVRVAGGPTSHAPGSRSFAMPKSSSFTLPDRDTKMFEGLRSRWTTRSRWACWTASHTTRNRRSRASSGSRSRRTIADRYAVDELHHEIGRAFGRDAAVEQARDVGMGQMCEHLSFGQKAIDGVGVARARSEDLDSHLLPIVAVCALGAIDRAHTAASENADQAPGPETAADQRTGVSRVGFPIVDESFDGQGTIGAGGSQHRFDLVTQRDIGATRLGQTPSARLNGLGVRELEEFLDPLPVHAVHGSSSSDRVKRV